MKKKIEKNRQFPSYFNYWCFKNCQHFSFHLSNQPRLMYYWCSCATLIVGLSLVITEGVSFSLPYPLVLSFCRCTGYSPIPALHLCKFCQTLRCLSCPVSACSLQWTLHALGRDLCEVNISMHGQIDISDMFLCDGDWHLGVFFCDVIYHGIKTYIYV